MSKLQNLILVVVLVLQVSISCAYLADVGDNEGPIKVARQIPLINSYYSNYNPSYAWRPWNSPYYQNYQPSARIPQTTTGLSPAVPAVESTYVDFGGPSSCRSDCSEERGNCLDPGMCSMAGGRASGSCANGFVCCVSVVNTCHSHGSWRGDGLVILNNTYWQSSLRPIEPSSSCTLTVKLDSRFPDPSNPIPNPLPIPYPQKPICQVRLDFLVFSISQPDSESVCSGDYFEVSGATNNVPTICGFNDEQHMYLHVPNSAYTPTDLQLTFNFGPSSNEIRAWNIRVSMIPCNSGNMAPSDCLQYFTSRTGSVMSFNWRDVAGSATRQLANQDYSICFRTVTVFQRQLCLTPCQVVTSQKPFSISTATTYTALIPPVPTFTTFTPDVSQLVSLNCNNDYLVVPGGFNIGNPPAVLNMAFDRYCGERFNALPGSTNSTTICTTAMPFRMLYRTNRDETFTAPTSDAPANSIPANGNRGFCLSFKV